MTGITHYGYRDFATKASDVDVETDLRELQRMGASVIRVYAPYNGIDHEEAARRLDRFLTRAAQHNLSVIVSLINYYSSRQNPMGTDQFYTEFWEGIPYLSHEFIAAGYQGAYKDFVRVVVSSNRHHPNIYAWEPGNELQDHQRDTFLLFMQDITAYIKSLDSDHPVATGMIEADQTGFLPEELYPQLPAIDIITIHPGNGYRKSIRDVVWAVEHGKKAIVEETGFSATDDRTDRFRIELNYWWKQGVSAFLLDGFIGKGLEDNGSGDKVLGWDALWHIDYDNIAAMLSEANH